MESRRPPRPSPRTASAEETSSARVPEPRSPAESSERASARGTRRSDGAIRRRPKRLAPARARAGARDGGLTAERVVRFLLGALALGAVAWLLWYFAGLVVYLMVGGLLAYLMRPVVHRLQGLGLGHLPAIAVAFVAVGGVVGGLVSAFAPFVIRQITDLSQQVSVEAIITAVQAIELRLLQEFPFLEAGVLTDSLREIADTLFREGRLQSTLGSALGLFTDIAYAVVVIPFVAFFFLKDGTRLRQTALGWVPNRYFEVTLTILSKVESSLGRYLRALVVQCSAVAAVASITLSFTGLDYALAVGLFAGLANSIPYFGPAVGFLAGSLVGVAQTGDFSLVLPVFIAMALTQLSDNLVFQPFIFSKAAKAHPLVILFVVLIGAQLAGIVGMLVAIPLATVVRVVVQEIFWSIRHYRILRV